MVEPTVVGGFDRTATTTAASDCHHSTRWPRARTRNVTLFTALFNVASCKIQWVSSNCSNRFQSITLRSTSKQSSGRIISGTMMGCQYGLCSGYIGLLDNDTRLPVLLVSLLLL